jgi:signal transduction histidine kinase/FixJ family two-component response regulator
MSPSTQLDLLAALGYAVFERTGVGSFQLSGTAPAWLPGGSLTDAFPFLEVFLPDAEEFWANPGSRSTLHSDLWTQTSAGGDEFHFSAVAVVGERQLLLIGCAEQRFQQTQAFVQYAHETVLAHHEIARLNLELKRATEAKSEFLARMSHEIRTPMNSVLGMAELLSETTLSAEQREYVRIFRRAGDNLMNIINDILDFSKVEAGQVELERIGFDLAEVVQGAVETIGVRARAKGLEIRCEIRPGVPPRLAGDPGRLGQILLNLLGNAVKFTDRGGIAVQVEPGLDEQTPGVLHFAVSDTGAGIPADRIAYIFDSFTQVDASTTREYGGTGLGLAISKRFVELMGGKIWAESTPGEGSTIHFTACFAKAEASIEPETGAGKAAGVSARAALGQRTLRILLADDSEDNRFLVRGYLRDTGCVIDEVENGAQAVEKFQHGAYDMVLMDAEMPVLDGYSATREMRARERELTRRPTPILVLTAHAFKESRDRSLEAGCTDHLTKPITKAGLLDAVGRHAPELPAATPVHVTVEAWLKPLVPAYLEKRRADVGKLRCALEQGDYATVRTLGHQMAGSGAGYGFSEITEIGAALEESALAGNATRARAGIEDLDRYLNTIHVV